MNFLAQKLSTLYPLCTNGNLKCYRPQKLIFPLVISGYKWSSPPDISPIKTTSPKKGTIQFGPKEHELTYQITKKGIVKRELYQLYYTLFEL
jgi:hypothetical protein